jgi:hypothetical protein
VSCGLFDDNDDDSDCLYDYITVENKCDRDITVGYNDQPGEFDWEEFIFGIDRCDVTERKELIIPDDEKDIRVFLGRCINSDDASPFDSCDSFSYSSDESITVQHEGATQDFFIFSNTHFEISPDDFD